MSERELANYLFARALVGRPALLLAVLVPVLRRRLLDHPNARSSHRRPTPRGGGLAFVLAEAVPAVGTVLEHPSGWRIEVTAGDETHVTRLSLHTPAQKEEVQ